MHESRLLSMHFLLSSRQRFHTHSVRSWPRFSEHCCRMRRISIVDPLKAASMNEMAIFNSGLRRDRGLGRVFL